MWELLYETFWDRLEHFCYKLCRDEARAEEMWHRFTPARRTAR